MTTTVNDVIAPIAKPSRARAATAKAARTPPSGSIPISKSDAVIRLLMRAKGATSAELIAATDWQAHSARAFLSNLRKKGRVIIREARKHGDIAYRIVVAEAIVASSAGTIVPGSAAAADAEA